MDRSIQNLKKLTDEFFSNHWPKDEPKRPEWKKWEFKGSVPNNERAGNYAWLDENDQVIYIGLALSMGDGIYKGHSLGHRISKYWNVDKEKGMDEDGNKNYKSTVGEDVKSIMTIGFEKYSYLAASFELFLIQALKPQRNKIYNYQDE